MHFRGHSLMVEVDILGCRFITSHRKQNESGRAVSAAAVSAGRIRVAASRGKKLGRAQKSVPQSEISLRKSQTPGVPFLFGFEKVGFRFRPEELGTFSRRRHFFPLSRFLKKS